MPFKVVQQPSAPILPSVSLRLAIFVLQFSTDFFPQLHHRLASLSCCKRSNTSLNLGIMSTLSSFKNVVYHMYTSSSKFVSLLLFIFIFLTCPQLNANVHLEDI